MTTTIRSLCICFRRYRRIFLYHFCHLVLRLLPWSLSKLLPPASIFSGFSTWRWIPGLGGKPPKTTQPSTSAGLGLGRLLRKNPETLGRDRSLDLKVTMPAVFNVYPPKTKSVFPHDTCDTDPQTDGGPKTPHLRLLDMGTWQRPFGPPGSKQINTSNMKGDMHIQWGGGGR